MSSDLLEICHYPELIVERYIRTHRFLYLHNQLPCMPQCVESLPYDEQELVEEYLDALRGQEKKLSGDWKKNLHNLVCRGLSILHDTRGKPLSQCTHKDILSCMAAIKENETFSKNYRRKMVHAFRRFLQWYAHQYHTLKPETIAAIKLPDGEWKTKRPEDMVSKQEFELLLKSARNARDRCLLAMLWDGSNRPIELLSLLWSDLIQDRDGYYFETKAKTGKARRIRLTFSLPYLDEWQRSYPGEPRGSNPVFTTINKVKGGPRKMTKDNLDRVIIDLKERTGMKKLKPSIFRPSRITSDVAEGYDPAYLMKKNWGHLKTNMLDLYTNLDADYIDQVALRRAGMQRVVEMKEREIYRIEPPTCPACKTLNVMGAKFCSKCLTPLTEEAREITTSTQDAVINHPELRTLLKAMGMTDSAIDLLLKQVRKE